MSPAISVAVVDSGVNTPHPHLPGVAGGIGLDLEGNRTEDYVDRLGHGTAAAAAIHEKAQKAELFAVKVFHDELATTVTALVRAIDWATERGIRIVNLSLGTPNESRRAALEPALKRAVARGTLVVSAFEHEGRRWYPGSMTGAVGVILDTDQPRHRVEVAEIAGRAVLRASPYPRPIPGVPPERNLNGISFAVANATGVLAAALTARPEVTSAADAIALVATNARGGVGA